MPKTLIIGGAGFIGTALCKHLVSSNDITVLDNYFTGSRNNHIGGVTYITGHASDINELFPNERFDYVFHFGEYSRVEQSFEEPSTVFNLNFQLHEVLRYCVKTDAKLIYSGSSTKFSKEGEALSPYSWTKVTNTNLIRQYSEWYNLNYAIVYFYNVYGPGELGQGKYATVIEKFKNKALAGERLTVTLPGTQVRNFTHINDTVEALDIVSKHGYGDGYGIGSDESYSVLDVATAFVGASRIDFTNPRNGNRMTASLVTSKTRDLGWAPKHKLMNYIKDLMDGN